jgi:lipopolysaccharide biosynthesis protein
MGAENCSIFFHNYYGDDHKWLSFFSNELTIPFTLFYNCVSSSYYRVNNAISYTQFGEHLPLNSSEQIHTRQSPNKGKDIGGKLILMDAYLKLGIKSDYILLLHDKRSPYHNKGNQWQKELFKIAEKRYQQDVLDAFRKDPQIGIVASESAIRNELNNDEQRNVYTDSLFIKALKDKYGIHPSSFQYVAGTMFWVRASLFEAFFTKNSPLAIRSELEEGNVLDNDQPTNTHAWERLLCWLVTAQGFKIRGV